MISTLKDAWQASAFHSEELAVFARNVTLNETRHGLVMLSVVLLAIFASGAALFTYFQFLGLHRIHHLPAGGAGRARHDFRKCGT